MNLQARAIRIWRLRASYILLGLILKLFARAFSWYFQICVAFFYVPRGPPRTICSETVCPDFTFLMIRQQYLDIFATDEVGRDVCPGSFLDQISAVPWSCHRPWFVRLRSRKTRMQKFGVLGIQCYFVSKFQLTKDLNNLKTFFTFCWGQ